MRPLPRPRPRTVELRGKRILLTGASSGIGEVAAEKLAAQGATVIVVARREHLLAQVVDRIVAQGGEAIAMATNLADMDAVDELVQRVGQVINVSSWRVMPESSPLFGVYNASKAALSAVSRVIDTELAESGVHSTTIYYPLVATPMIAPTRAYDGLAALSADEAANWIVDAARTRPVRIAPRKTLALRALDIVSPRLLSDLMMRSTPPAAPDDDGGSDR
ncbi:SDR family NAD(P)-dependent oxidoreductase [Mycolicibacterium sp. CR10]|uniref:SDR family NAD(P)-dependent oxidoreductase n=1 Tax=Mycolicibacterium sp. CR10 TaxID=2562314 RepID=UPI0010C0F0C7|nr:SDR family NAD(P)-dependent oxidoreductase [Mycolicibacterium sp. CR10]